MHAVPPYYKLKSYDEVSLDPMRATFRFVDMKSSILKICQQPGYVMGMVLEVYLVSEQSKFFNIFTNFNKII